MGGTPLLKAEHIYKSFGPTRAVQDFSIEIYPGEIHGLVGENGSGKSTVSSIFAGVQPMDSGTITVREKPYNPSNMNDAAENGIAMVVQEIGTIGSISAAANIFLNKEKMFAKRGLIDFKRMNQEAASILNEIGGEHINPDTICSALNLEDRKLVELAKAIYSKPILLIIDETSNALASKGRNILYKNMKAIKEAGGSVLFITHDLDELIMMSDTVTIMRDGKYVDTLTGDKINTHVIKELMVGREIADNYYRTDFEPKYENNVVFKAENLCSPGVNNVSFELHQGEILGIGGLADSGMHELGRLLFGIENPDSGSVTVGSHTVKTPKDAVKNGIAYMSKNRDTEALLLQYTISNNIVLPSLDSLWTGPVILKKRETKLAEKWADELSIKRNNIDQFCSELSGGNKQKVVLAKWLANNSKILIMDCPTRGIDIGVKEAIYKLMQRFKDEGRSMILISEEMTEVIGMSDRILIMKRGKVEKEVVRNKSVTESEIIHYMM